MTPFTCPACGTASHHPMDKAQGYCARCSDHTAPTMGLWMLRGHEPVPAELPEFLAWYRPGTQGVVARTLVAQRSSNFGKVLTRKSLLTTSFLPVPAGREDRRLFFETKGIGAPVTIRCYQTWDEAAEGHREAVAALLAEPGWEAENAELSPEIEVSFLKLGTSMEDQAWPAR